MEGAEGANGCDGGQLNAAGVQLLQANIGTEGRPATRYSLLTTRSFAQLLALPTRSPQPLNHMTRSLLSSEAGVVLSG